MTFYEARLSPNQLFVGTIFHEERVENDEDGYPITVEELWEQEPIEVSYAKLKNGIESLGLECVDIQFDDYDSRNGVLNIKNIICKYNENNPQLLDSLLNDEAYISTGIACWDFAVNTFCTAIYFKH